MTTRGNADNYLELQRQADWLSRTALLFCALFVLSAVVFSVAAVTHPFWLLGWWLGAASVACFWLAFAFRLAGVRAPKRRRLRHPNETDGPLVEALRDLAPRLGLRRLPRLEIATAGSLPSYFEYHPLFRRDRLILNEHFLRVLSPDETRALMAHELAHIRLLRRHYGDNLLPAGALMVTALLLYVSVGLTPLFPWSLAVPLLAVAAGWFVFSLSERVVLWLLPLLRAHEHLADHHAAECAGRLHTVNALLKIGHRLEMLEEVERTVEHLPDRPRTLWRDRIFTALPSELLDPDLVRGHAEAILRSEGLEPAPRLDEGPPEAATPLATLSPSRRIDWRFFDTREQDGRLDPEELEQFVHALIRDGAGRLFNLPEENPDRSRFQVHPSLRRRILFLCGCHHLPW